jgi:predicted nucleic acid-binding protein
MALVADASVAVLWLMNLEGADNADAILQPKERLIAPDLVVPEITSALWKSVAFANTPEDVAVAALGRAAEFFDEIVPSVILKDQALQIAVELRHPVYDCFYLALAEQRDCHVVTADDRLISRCARTRYAARVQSLIAARRGRRR